MQSPWIAIAAGLNYSMAMKADGTVWAWGENSAGQLGVGIGTPLALTPQQVGTVMGGVQSPLGGGFLHSAAVKYSGAMWSWGDNVLGELWLPPSVVGTNRPAQAANAGYVMIAANNHVDSTLGMKVDGTVWAWGANEFGQLGIGSSIPSTNVPVQVVGLSNVQMIALGGDINPTANPSLQTAHGMALMADGTVKAWGRNSYGQLGNGTTTDANSPVQVLGLSNVVSVAAGGRFSLALRSDGTVWAWGSNRDHNDNNTMGVLGANTPNFTNRPMRVVTITNVVAIAAGTFAAVAIRSDGLALVWGGNLAGEQGTGDTDNNSYPTPRSLVTNATQVAASCLSLYAVRADGTVWGWGRNANGQLGDGTTTSPRTPRQAIGLTNVVKLACGHYNVRALKSDGTVWGWGLSSNGQLGDNVTSITTPTQISFLNNIIDISGGKYHSTWLTCCGTVWGSGTNNLGQLGNPVRVTPQVEIKEFYALNATTFGAYHSLSLKADGSVWTVGANWTGQLGTGSGVISTNEPLKIGSLSNVVQVVSGQDHCMALTTNGQVWSWGYNGQGQLGNGTTITTNRPILVSSLSNVRQVACGFYHSMALLTNGTIRAWGYGGYGNLGNGSTNSEVNPVTVAGLNNVVAIAAGGYHNLALKSDGTVWSWGYNGYGQLGDNTYDPDPLSPNTVPHWTPTQVLGPGGVGFLTNIVDIVAGGYHSMALSSDGYVYAWGGSWLGQVGDGGTNYAQVVPVKLLSLTNVVAIGRGDFHSLALRADGTVWAWGANWLGQLGDGSTIQRNTPVQAQLPLP